MNEASAKPGNSHQRQGEFSAAYGRLPRFFWYAVVPFLLLASLVLFVRAVWFGEGVPLASNRVPPGVVALVVCPLLWGLCGLLAALEVYGLRNPQFVLVAPAGVQLPRGRFTAETVSIAWRDLQATFRGSNLLGWHVYEIVCTDLRSGATARISSALFGDFDDFATFTQILARHMGQDWSIRGFLPGTLRGDTSAADAIDLGTAGDPDIVPPPRSSRPKSTDSSSR